MEIAQEEALSNVEWELWPMVSFMSDVKNYFRIYNATLEITSKKFYFKLCNSIGHKESS